MWFLCSCPHRDNVTQDDLVPAVSIMVTVLFIVAGGYVMSYLVWVLHNVCVFAPSVFSFVFVVWVFSVSVLYSLLSVFDVVSLNYVPFYSVYCVAIALVFSKLEEERVSSAETTFVDSSGRVKIAPQLRVHELRGETYNGMVRLLKPGCRTIVVLCDSESKSKLMPKFHKACWPYRKYVLLIHDWIISSTFCVCSSSLFLSFITV